MRTSRVGRIKQTYCGEDDFFSRKLFHATLHRHPLMRTGCLQFAFVIVFLSKHESVCVCVSVHHLENVRIPYTYIYDDTYTYMKCHRCECVWVSLCTSMRCVNNSTSTLFITYYYCCCCVVLFEFFCHCLSQRFVSMILKQILCFYVVLLFMIICFSRSSQNNIEQQHWQWIAMLGIFRFNIFPYFMNKIR